MKKVFKFILNKKSNLIIFNLSFLLFLAKFYFSLEKLNYKKDILIVYNINYFKIAFILLIKVIIFYI